MGRFVYSRGITGEFDDRALAHLQAVIGAKLRRGEGCLFSWDGEGGSTGELTVVWINRSVTMAFIFEGEGDDTLNRAWLDALLVTADSSEGLRLVPEPDPSAGPPLDDPPREAPSAAVLGRR